MEPIMKSEDLALMTQIIWSIPRIYHRMTGMSERLYAQVGLTAGKRSLLRDIAVQGPHTIAEMVRVRPPITRQYIQRLISELRHAGLVDLSVNSEDRRSKVVSLTDQGRRVIDDLAPAEQKLTEMLIGNHDTSDLKAAAEILNGIANLLEQNGTGTSS
jgi:DNA-binding MarR family transcriptional regulator